MTDEVQQDEGGCPVCGAAVVNATKHETWHGGQATAAKAPRSPGRTPYDAKRSPGR